MHVCLGFSTLCLFKYVLKTFAREDTKSHCLHLFDFAFWNMSSNCIHSHIGRICLTFLFCMFSNVSYNPNLRGCTATLVIFVLIFFIVCFLLCPQIGCPIRYLITLVAFDPLFPSTVCYQMLVQQDCIRGCKITFVAFVCLFSTICFSMYPKIPCLRGCIA